MGSTAPHTDELVQTLVERLATRLAPICRGVPPAEFAKLVHMLVELDLCVRGFRDLQALVRDRVAAQLEAERYAEQAA